MKQEITRWQWHQLDHMQIICTLLHTDNHGSTSSLTFYMLDGVFDAQPTVWRTEGCNIHWCDWILSYNGWQSWHIKDPGFSGAVSVSVHCSIRTDAQSKLLQRSSTKVNYTGGHVETVTRGIPSSAKPKVLTALHYKSEPKKSVTFYNGL